MPEVLFEKRDNIAFITLNRPEVMNARNNALRALETAAWGRVNDEDDILVAIITGAGDRAFCAGADLKEMAQPRDPAAPRVRIPQLSTGEVQVWKPIIAAIHGYCLGGGLEMAMACDIRIASEDAILGLPEVRAIGALPEAGGTVRLARLIPLGMALELVFTGDRISAQEAFRLGLVNKVVPRDQLMPTAEALARKICENNPAAVRAAKMTAIRSRDMHLLEGMALLNSLNANIQLAEDTQERRAAIAEKRPPVWKGR